MDFKGKWTPPGLIPNFFLSFRAASLLSMTIFIPPVLHFIDTLSGRETLLLCNFFASFSFPGEPCGPFNVPSAPVFYPTLEEFRDPWVFLNSIKEEIQKSGICVIEPPDNADAWDKDSFEKFIDPLSFKMETKAQNVHQMQNRNSPSAIFVLNLMAYWNERGRPMMVMPEVNGVILDLYSLKNHVVSLGGFAKV